MQESHNIEWKSNWRDEFLKWISGFANAQGGKLFIGINDKGEITGIPDGKRLLEEIPNKIQTQLGIICDVNLVEKESKSYIEINVNQYDIPISYHGKYYFRSGSTNKLLQGNELSKLLLKKAGKTWDEVIEPRALIDDIDIIAVEAFKNQAFKSKRMPFVKNEKDTKIILDNLMLMQNNQIKRSAIILFGKNPEKFYVNAYAKIGRFGKSDDDLRFQEVIEGNAYQLADKILDVLDRKFLVSPITYEGVYRIENWEYPYESIREAVINAIIHKDYMGAPIQISVYDDKLIIWNEGTLPYDLSIEDLRKKHSSRPHNPLLANTFFKGGLIEAWGRGTIKIINECINAGFPEPSIEYSSGGIKITLFKNIFSEEKLIKIGLNSRQIKAIMFIKERSKITNSEYQRINNISKATATRDLNELLRKFKLIIKVGKTGIGTFYEFKGS